VIEGELHSIKPEGPKPLLVTNSLSDLSWEWFVWGNLTWQICGLIPVHQDKSWKFKTLVIKWRLQKV